MTENIQADSVQRRQAVFVRCCLKILVLERLYNMSDDQAEFQINDRRSFMRFLGLESYDTVPDVVPRHTLILLLQAILLVLIEEASRGRPLILFYR